MAVTLGDGKSPALYLLDTNMISYIANGLSAAARRTMDQLGNQHPIATSAIAEGEILYGLARKPGAARLQTSTQALLSVIEVFPWDSAAARSYATVRAQLTSTGKTLAALDMLIAAHAIALDAILVTHDKAFRQIEALRPTVDWATDL